MAVDELAKVAGVLGFGISVVNAYLAYQDRRESLELRFRHGRIEILNHSKFALIAQSLAACENNELQQALGPLDEEAAFPVTIASKARHVIEMPFAWRTYLFMADPGEKLIVTLESGTGKLFTLTVTENSRQEPVDAENI